MQEPDLHVALRTTPAYSQNPPQYMEFGNYFSRPTLRFVRALKIEKIRDEKTEIHPPSLPRFRRSLDDALRSDGQGPGSEGTPVMCIEFPLRNIGM